MKRKRRRLLVCVLLLIVMATPNATTARGAAQDTSVLVGLAYGKNALDGANLLNAAGSGYRFGYLDQDRVFQELGRTHVRDISMVKGQNVWYDKDLNNYFDDVTSHIGVGCWHVRLPVEAATYEEALAAAQETNGFPAWIDGAWEVRRGAYLTQTEAQTQADMAGGNVVGAGSYGVSVVQTGTSDILFQFDGGADRSLAVSPGLDDSERAVTWFKGYRYWGIFQYRRIDGGDLTVSNLVPQEDYINCVLSREMSGSWPLEALKAQALCAGNYYATNLGKHKAYGFDICATTDCQVYYGMSQTNDRTAQAVAQTAGLRVWYHGKLASTYYFSSDGGGTEDVRNVWGGATYPYLCGVIDPYEETISDKVSYWDYTKTYTAGELAQMLRKLGYICADIVDVRTQLTPTGNVKTLTFVDANAKTWSFSMDKAREFLGMKSIRYTVAKSEAGGYPIAGGSALPSMDGVYAISGDGSVARLSGNLYVITDSGVQPLPASTQGTTAGDTVYTFIGRGYGHSVGMSQWGAYAMAQLGHTFDEIIRFYYPGVEIY